MNILLSERQKARTLQLLKDMYTAHLADPECELGENCPQLQKTKATIEKMEQEAADCRGSV